MGEQVLPLVMQIAEQRDWCVDESDGGSVASTGDDEITTEPRSRALAPQEVHG